MATSAAPLDRDVAPVMTKWDVPVQPIVVVNGEMIYGLQEKQEVLFHHTPLSDRWEAHGSPIYIAYGGAAGGAKSHGSRAILTRMAYQWPGSTSIIFRKTLPELEANHIEKFFEEVPNHLFHWTGGRKMMAKWPNGSRTYFGYLGEDKHKHRYQGSEYDLMIFEESTHYAEKTVNWLVSNRLRATTDLSKPFAIYPSNPGSVGHFWYNRLFIARRFKEDEGEVPSEYAFIQAKLEDNQILCRRDPGYLAKLNKLAEPWRSWLRDGDFESGAGLFFIKLSRKVHLVRPFDPPAHWTMFGAFDWGYNHPWGYGVYTANEDGTVFKVATFRGRYDTHKEIVKSIQDQAKAAKVDLTRVVYTASGLDAFHKTGRELGWDGPTMADEMMEADLTPIEANVGRIYGASNLRNYLEWRDEVNADGVREYMEPELYFMDNAGNRMAFECLETRVSDEDNIEDVLKTDANEHGEGGDEDYDVDRYALASRPERAFSIGLHRKIRAFDPEVMQAEHDELYKVKDPRGRREETESSRGL